MTQRPENLSTSENPGMAGDGEIKHSSEISRIVELHGLGWKIRAIARELGISRHTVKKYIRNGGAADYLKLKRRRILEGLGEWLKERFSKHEGNANVVRHELADKGIIVSLRTVKRAVKVHRDELHREKRSGSVSKSV